MDILKIKPAVTHRCCPSCGYLILQREIDLFKFAMKCPRGCNKTINEFQPINLGDI